MSIEISTKPRINYGNSFLATFNRNKRLAKGQDITFTDDVKLLKDNPFGTYSAVRLWNEDIEHRKYLKRVKKWKHPRGADGRFVNI